MIIKSPFEEYNVQKKITSTNKYDIYICKQIKAHINHLCTVNIIKDSKLIKKYLPIFLVLYEQKCVEDFIDFFIKDTYLFIVFRYYNEKTLITSMNTYDFSFSKKLEIAGNFLFNSKSSDLPTEVLYIILEDCTFNNLLKTNFNYFLKFSDDKTLIHTADLVKKAGYILKRFFSLDELIKNPKLNDILQKSFKYQYDSFDSFYIDFDKYIQNLETPKHNESSTIFKKLLKYCTTFVVTILIAVSLLWVFSKYFRTIDTLNEENSYSGLNQIGTINLNQKSNE